MSGGKLKLLAIALSAILFLCAIWTSSIIAIAQEENRILTIALNEDIDSPNPYVGVNDASYVFFGLVYDYLITPNEDLINVPNLASSWWVLDGNLSASMGSDFSLIQSSYKDPGDWLLGSIWQYNLTKNVFWSDGVPFTADDVVWTINIQLGANYNIFWAYQPYTRWIDHIEKIDDLTVRIFFADFDTKKPVPISFGNNLFIPIMPKHCFEGKESTYLAQSWDGVPAIGTGPFKGTPSLHADVIAKETVTVVRNKFYNFVDEDGVRKGLGAAYNRTIEIDTILLKCFSDESTLSMSIRTGESDAGKVTPATYLAWQTDKTLPKSLSLAAILSCTGFSKQVVINDYEEAYGDINPLRLDPAVQRAAAIAVNKTYIKDVIYKGLAEIGYSLLPPVWQKWYWEPGDEPSTFNVINGSGNVIWSYTKPLRDALAYNISLANEILDAAGYQWTGAVGASPRRAGPLAAERMHYLFGADYNTILGMELRFDMMIAQGDPQEKAVGDLLLSEWEKIGIWIESPHGDHTPSMVNTASWNTDVYSYHFEMTQTYWSGDVDPNYLCYIPTSYSLFGWNEFGTKDADYDRMYYNQVTALDYETRKYWVDRCAEWQYLSSNIITTVYPKICFAINNDTWKNWGDWVAHPGMAIDAFWGENPLWWHLVYDPDKQVQPDVQLAVAFLALMVAIVVVVWILVRRQKRGKEEIDEEQ